MKHAKLKTVTASLALAGLISTTLVGCGGSSSSPETSNTLSGTVATGRAYPSGTSIRVQDATGATVGTGTITGTDGAYSVTIDKTAVLPLVITASADGEQPMVSVSTSANGTANVTPLTHLLAASLSPSGDPSQLASEIQNGSATVTSETVSAKVAEVQSLVAAVSGTTSSSTDNPLTTAFKADGTGMDRTLEVVKVKVAPQTNADGTRGATQIQIFSTAAADAAAGSMDAPIVLRKLNGQMTNAEGAVTAKLDAVKLPAVAANALPPAGAIVQVNALLSRMSACYNQPKTSRFSGTTLSDTCKAIFWGNDPATYKNNSYTVGATTTGKATAWNSIFNNADTTTLAYDQAQIMYTASAMPSGGTTTGTFPVVQVRWTASFPCADDDTQTCQNTGYDRYVLRADDTGKLYQYGNQSDYDIAVDPRVELRDFPNFKDANQKSYSYYNVGYNLYVENLSTIGKVVVTTPKGNKITLAKIVGDYSYLGIKKSTGVVSTSSVIRMAAEYVDTTTTSSSGTAGTAAASSNHPRDIDSTLAWSADFNDAGTFTGWKNWTDAEIAAIPDQGVWKFEIYGPTDTLLATEQRRTTARIPTLAETRKITWPTLTTAYRDLLVSKTTATGGFALATATPLYITADMTATGGAAWDVPTGAWAPTGVKVYGTYGTRAQRNANPVQTSAFDDGVDVRSSWRKATIKCSGTDGHCNGAGTYKPYVDNTTPWSGFGQIQFYGYDARRVQNTLSVNTRIN